MYIYYLSLLFAFSHKFKRNEIMQYTKLNNGTIYNQSHDEITARRW